MVLYYYLVALIYAHVRALVLFHSIHMSASAQERALRQPHSHIQTISVWMQQNEQFMLLTFLGFVFCMVYRDVFIFSITATFEPRVTFYLLFRARLKILLKSFTKTKLNLCDSNI